MFPRGPCLQNGCCGATELASLLQQDTICIYLSLRVSALSCGRCCSEGPCQGGTSKSMCLLLLLYGAAVVNQDGSAIPQVCSCRSSIHSCCCDDGLSFRFAPHAALSASV